MTNIFLRIEREGRYVAVDLDEMTDAELDAQDAFMARQDPRIAWHWAKGLARWIRDHPERLDKNGL